MVTVFVLVGALSGAAPADKMIVGDDKQSYSMQLERIVDFREGMMVYLPTSGPERTKPLREILLITIDGQDMFNQAEQLRRDKKPDEALAAYDTVITGENPAWLKQVARYRKVEMMAKDGKIDSAVLAWLELVAVDSSSAALKLLPQDLPAKGDERNAQAIGLLEPRLNDLKNKAVRLEAGKLLMRLYRREGMDQKADQLAATLTGQQAPPPATTDDNGAGGIDKTSGDRTRAPAGADRARASTVLAAAAGLIRPGQKPETLADQVAKLEADLPQFSSADLAPALLLIGKGKLYQAARQTDVEARKPLLLQAGLSLMRAKLAAGNRHGVAAEALFYAGQANELLGNLQAAEKAYLKVLTDSDYKKVKDVAAEAAKGKERIEKKKADKEKADKEKADKEKRSS